MAWRGLDQNNLWVSRSKDGVSWTPQTELTDKATQSGPALTGAFGFEGVYMAWRGLEQNNIFVACSTDGIEWTPQVELEDRATRDGPALSISNGEGTSLYMIWRGLDQENLWSSHLGE